MVMLDGKEVSKSSSTSYRITLQSAGLVMHGWGRLCSFSYGTDFIVFHLTEKVKGALHAARPATNGNDLDRIVRGLRTAA